MVRYLLTALLLLADGAAVAEGGIEFRGIKLGITIDELRAMPHPDGTPARVACTHADGWDYAIDAPEGRDLVVTCAFWKRHWAACKEGAGPLPAPAVGEPKPVHAVCLERVILGDMGGFDARFRFVRDERDALRLFRIDVHGHPISPGLQSGGIRMVDVDKLDADSRGAAAAKLLAMFETRYGMAARAGEDARLWSAADVRLRFVTVTNPYNPAYKDVVVTYLLDPLERRLRALMAQRDAAKGPQDERGRADEIRRGADKL